MNPRVFLWSGLLLLVFFFITGIYMQDDFNRLHGGDQVIRYLYRASHIYLLFAALVLLLCATSTPPTPGPRLRHMMADTLVLTGSLVLVVAFWIEPAGKMESREITLLALLSLLVGVGFKTLVHITDQKRLSANAEPIVEERI